MAGLTKAQKDEKAQKESADKALSAAILASGLTAEEFGALSDEEKAAFFVEEEGEEQDDGLVAMVKDGEELYVHPTCVQAHKEAGWKVGGIC